MKVNNANLQVYNHSISQRQQVPQQQEAKPAEPNQFANATFSDFLSALEKKYITQNFKPDTTPNKSSHLGKVIDIRA